MRRPIGLLLALAASPTVAAPTVEASEIVVTGTGLAAPPGTPAYGSVIIPRERLGGSASGRLEDILRDVAGFQQFRRVDSRAANPTSQGATLRALGGNASSRALVLLDGVPQADPFAGYIPFAALAPERLSFARVTRGGGIGPFGAGAVAGTIELESAGPDDQPAFGGRAFGGSRDATELSLGVAPGLGDGFVTIDGRWDRGGGYILVPRDQRGAVDIPARYDAKSLGLRGVFPAGANGELQVRGLVFDDDRLRGQRGTANESRGADASLRFVSRGSWGLDALVYVQERDFASGFVSTTPDRGTGTPTLDQFKTPSRGLGGKFEVRPPTGDDNVLRLGIDARHSSGRTNERFRFVAGEFTRLRRAGGETLTAGLFVENDLTLGDLVLTGGARLDRWRISDGSLTERDIGPGTIVQALTFADRAGWRPSFRAGALYSLTGALALRGAGYTGFRLPTLNELYRPFRVGADATAANADLRLEKLRGIEGGFDYRPIAGARLGVTLFHNELRDAVANVTVGSGPGTFPQVGFVGPGGAFRQRLNVNAIEVTGLEVTASLAVGDFDLGASYAWTDAVVRAAGAAAALDGLRPAQSPEHQASATLAWTPARGPDLAMTLRHVGGQFEDDLQSRRLPAATTLDAVAGLRLKDGLRLVARIENAFGERVVSGISATGVTDLGTPRTLWLGVTYRR